MAVDYGCGLWLWTMAPQHLLVAFSSTLVYVSMMVMTVVLRHAPGTLQATLAEELGLVHKEVTLVMTDVQASSKLWEWSVSFSCCMMSCVCIPGLCVTDAVVSHACVSWQCIHVCMLGLMS